MVVTFFTELVLVLIGFTFKEVMFRVLKDDMLKSFNSTEPGVIKSWNVIQRDVTQLFLFKNNVITPILI